MVKLKLWLRKFYGSHHRNFEWALNKTKCSHLQTHPTMCVGDTPIPLYLRDIQEYPPYVCVRYRDSFFKFAWDIGIPSTCLWEIQACPSYVFGRYRHTIRNFVGDVPSFLTILRITQLFCYQMRNLWEEGCILSWSYMGVVSKGSSYYLYLHLAILLPK